MKKVLISAFLLLFVYFNANCQLLKGDWLAGGSGSFYSAKVNTLGITTRFSNIQLLPNFGYFFAEKVAVGIKAEISFNKDRASGPSNRAAVSNFYLAGPFLRYYILDPSNKVNLFVEGSYAYGILRNGGTQDRFTDKFSSYQFMAGPEIFLNSSVGVQFGFGYYHNKSLAIDQQRSDFRMSLGFQIHLEKDE